MKSRRDEAGTTEPTAVLRFLRMAGRTWIRFLVQRLALELCPTSEHGLYVLSPNSRWRIVVATKPQPGQRSACAVAQFGPQWMDSRRTTSEPAAHPVLQRSLAGSRPGPAEELGPQSGPGAGANAWPDLRGSEQRRRGRGPARGLGGSHSSAVTVSVCNADTATCWSNGAKTAGPGLLAPDQSPVTLLYQETRSEALRM